MRTGSVIIDMAAANGGNTELTRTDQVITSENGVTIIGYTDLAGRLPAQTSQLYGTNIVNLLNLMTPEKDGNLVLDLDDVIVRGITIATGGESMWPPPAVQVSAAPAAPKAAQAPAKEEKPALTARGKMTLVLGAIAAFFLVNATAPDPMPRHFTTLTLSIVIGYYVIGKVAHALHTPLMSVTNAISGVVVVGGLLQVSSHDHTVQAVSTVAILLASINICGGFAVTRRMLGMFNKGA